MKIIRLLLIAVLVTFAAPLPIAAQSNAAFTNGRAAQLTATQIKDLLILNTAVAVPTFIPTDYKLKNFEIEKPDAPGVIFYNLVYSNARGKTFTFQSGNDGLGDIDYKNGVKTKNSYFEGLIDAGFDDDKRVIVGWISSLKKYQPKNVETSQAYSLIADPGSLTRQQAAQIMGSLRYLKR